MSTVLYESWDIQHSSSICLREEKSVTCFHSNTVLVDFGRFSCGRWLAKNMDDGSTERLLVAELMKIKGTEEGNICVTVCVSCKSLA